MLIIQLLGPNTIELMEGNNWSLSVDQPKIQIAEYSLSVGPTKSETEVVKVWVTYLLLVEPTPCLISLKREEQQHAIFSNVTRAAGLPFSNYSSISNSSQLSIPQEIMSSGTVHATDLCITAQRLLAATKMHGKWEIWWKTHNHAHPGSKRTQGVTPTAQTREKATLLMLIWLEKCGLVEGSESRGFGNHELLSLGLLGGMMMSLWKPKSHETCIDLTLHKKPTN